MLYFYIIYSTLIIIITVYFKKNKLLSNYTGDTHQLFSNKDNIPLLGGIFLIVPILLMNYETLIYQLLVLLIFLVGFLSDRKILISPQKRFMFQIVLVFISVVFLNLEILSSKLIFFDNLLKIKIFNIIFSSFCLLILINGSNFIDGLNSLLLIYMTLVIIILYKLNLISGFSLNDDSVKYLILFLMFLIVLNLLNLLMLGDAGAYILSFFVGYLIISSHKINANISPYFYIAIIWYPCYENLFSIIRKIRSKFSPLKPDNKHLHQLLYIFISKKIFSNKLSANNVSSLLINIINFIIIYISSLKPYSSIYQIKLITLSLIIYTIVFLYLKMKIKNYER